MIVRPRRNSCNHFHQRTPVADPLSACAQRTGPHSFAPLLTFARAAQRGRTARTFQPLGRHCEPHSEASASRFTVSAADPLHLVAQFLQFGSHALAQSGPGRPRQRLDSFGNSLEDVKRMRFLRQKLGPDVLTFAEHQGDAILPFFGGYSETSLEADCQPLPPGCKGGRVSSFPLPEAAARPGKVARKAPVCLTAAARRGRIGSFEGSRFTSSRWPRPAPGS
jgi:hypothetical protein